MILWDLRHCKQFSIYVFQKDLSMRHCKQFLIYVFQTDFAEPHTSNIHYIFQKQNYNVLREVQYKMQPFSCQHREQ